MADRVDHEQRRRLIAEALWSIASTRGLHEVGLREIASEAGISLGQLQHYFASKDQMLVFALTQIGQAAAERVERRLAALPGPSPTPYAVIRATLQEMLPLNPAARTGLLVHVAYLARAVHDPQLRAATVGGVRPLTALFADQLRRAIAAGQVGADRDPDTEATTLLFLADGMSNYVLLEAYTPDQACRVLDAHLAQLFGAPQVDAVREGG